MHLSSPVLPEERVSSVPRLPDGGRPALHDDQDGVATNPWQLRVAHNQPAHDAENIQNHEPELKQVVRRELRPLGGCASAGVPRVEREGGDDEKERGASQEAPPKLVNLPRTAARSTHNETSSPILRLQATFKRSCVIGIADVDQALLRCPATTNRSLRPGW